MKPLALRCLVWSLAGLALAGTWLLYTRPDFMVRTADLVWTCF